jgi:Flp pilus assembly protein TadD
MKSCAAVPFLVAVLLTSVSAQIVTERNRTDALRHYRTGENALHNEKYAEAEKEFQTAAKLDPLLDLAHYGLGQVYMATKRYHEAVRAYLKCREANATMAAEALQDETAYQRLLDDRILTLEDAKHGYEMGIAKTANTQATILRLDTQIKQLQYQRKRGAERPEGSPAWISIALGSAYFRTGATADAERQYRTALAADPKLGEAHNNLAVVCMLTGRLAEAESEIKAAEKAGFKVNPQLKDDLKKAKP